MRILDKPVQKTSEKRLSFEELPPDEPDSKNTGSIKKKKWITRSMAEDFGREDVLRSTLRESIIYLTFVVFLTIGTVRQHNISQFYLTETVKKRFLEHSFPANQGGQITFAGITTSSDFWHYVEYLMIPSFYPEGYPESLQKEVILYENKLLGCPRLRQVKVENNSCPVLIFPNFFEKCYGPYRKSIEDRKTFGPGTETAWVYSTSKVTKKSDYDGIIATYGGGGFYTDLPWNNEAAMAEIQDLERNLWITRGTRVVFADFSIYNPNLNIFTVTKLVFEFSPSGKVIPTSSQKSMFLLKFDGWVSVAVFVCECIAYGFVAYFCLEELREIGYFKLRYFCKFWTYIDLIIIVLSICLCVSSLFYIMILKKALNEILKAPAAYANLESVTTMYTIKTDLAAALLFFAYIKIFEFLNFNKTMGQLNNTLRRCALDILAFIMMFSIIFLAYADVGYLVFGDKVCYLPKDRAGMSKRLWWLIDLDRTLEVLEERRKVGDFNTFGKAMFTLLRTNLGDFDYPTIRAADPVLGPIYFLSYIFIVFFILMNMFLAIINDAYADVKTEISKEEEEEMQMIDFIKNKVLNLLKSCGCCKHKSYERKREEKNPTTEALREAFKKCGFSLLEIEMFFARYNIDPNAEVGDYDIKRVLAEVENLEQGRDDDTALLELADFVKQQNRLDAIETSIKDLVRKIETLMKKLDVLKKI